MNTLATIQSIFKYNNQKSGASVTISSISGSNVSSYTNPSSYTISGHNVYQIINTNAMSTSGGTSVTNVSGTFSLSVSGGTATLYYIVIGAGGGGGSGDQGGGGGSSGQIQYGSLTIPTGTYSCSFQIGGGGPGSGWVSSSSTFSNGANGYGVIGGTSSLTINGTTITSIGGNAGGPSYYSNGCTTGAYGGGAGCNIGDGSTLTGSNGQVSHNGGNSSNTACTSGGGGGSPSGNGGNGSFGSSSGSQSVSGVGGLGGSPISSTTIGWGFSTVQYFCEGGHGSASFANSAIATVAGQISSYALAGYSSGIGSGTATNGQHATQSVNHTGSGGSGCFQQNGLGSSNSHAPAGSNGLILLYA